jgi:hypothetical protein
MALSVVGLLLVAVTTALSLRMPWSFPASCGSMSRPTEPFR